MKEIYKKFSSMNLLHHLYGKIGMLFKPQHFIIDILLEALTTSKMFGILGREGIGKSTAIAKFIQDNSHVYYVRIGSTYAIANFFNEMIYQVSGSYPAVHETLFTKMKTLSYLLTQDNSKKLIIVDDAGRLSPRALSVFFELRDNTIHTTGFAFVGLSYFQTNLLRARKKGVPGISEFYRRIQNWFSVPQLNKNEIAAYGADKKLTDDQIILLTEMGIETVAELENMTEAIKREADFAKKEGITASNKKLRRKKLVQPDLKPNDREPILSTDEKKHGKRESAAKARAAKESKKDKANAD